jgi:hypothetical protein
MTDKQPEALRLADWIERGNYNHEDVTKAAAELRRLHEVNAELVEIFKRIRLEQGFACECGIEDSTWGLIESAIAKATGEQQ